MITTSFTVAMENELETLRTSIQALFAQFANADSATRQELTILIRKNQAKQIALIAAINA